MAWLLLPAKGLPEAGAPERAKDEKRESAEEVWPPDCAVVRKPDENPPA